MRSIIKAVVTVILSAKDHVLALILMTVLTAKMLKTESSAYLNVLSRSTQKMEIVTVVMTHAAAAKDLETQSPKKVA